MDQLIIKELTLNKLDEFYALFEKVLTKEFPEYSENTKKFFITNRNAWPKERYKEFLEDGDRILLYASVNDKIVGLVDSEKPFGGVCYGFWLMVDMEMQKKGIGRALLKVWEEKALELGAHAIFLSSADFNLAFYEKMGFKRIGLFEKSWFGTDDYFLAKHLQEPKEENYLR